MSGGWDKALDAQTALVHAYEHPAMLAYLNGFAQQMLQTEVWEPETGEIVKHDRRGNAEEEREVVTILRGAIAGTMAAEPVWVNRDVASLIEVAAETFEPEAIYLDDVFTPHGFALFEQPVWFPDSHGKRTSMRAVQWTPVTSKYQDEWGELHDAEALLIAIFGHSDDVDEGYDGPLPMFGGSALQIAHVNIIRFGDAFKVAEPGLRAMMKRVQVMWRLAQQTIAVHSEARASRATWKRARATWREIKTVQVLTLRRASSKQYGPDDGEGGIEWSHRWMVSGHWRSQPYKIDGKVVHRQIWIAPYVKGPDDAPFVPKLHATELVR